MLRVLRDFVVDENARGPFVADVNRRRRRRRTFTAEAAEIAELLTKMTSACSASSALIVCDQEGFVFCALCVDPVDRRKL
jgi:hypothetical protein